MEEFVSVDERMPPMRENGHYSVSVLAFDAYTGDSALVSYFPNEGWGELFGKTTFSSNGWLPWKPTHWVTAPLFFPSPLIANASS
jgi:hypothetical protein